jgi:hypothetical protein
MAESLSLLYLESLTDLDPYKRSLLTILGGQPAADTAPFKIRKGRLLYLLLSRCKARQGHCKSKTVNYPEHALITDENLQDGPHTEQTNIAIHVIQRH